MSTDKKHEYKDIPALTVVYIRNAVNNPAWAGELQDWINGCDALRTIPKLVIPKQLREDDEIFAWSDENRVSFSLTDVERDTIRKALKKVFEVKGLPVNQFSVRLITEFNLKS